MEMFLVLSLPRKMQNAFLRVLFKCPTPATVFETAAKPSRLAHFSKVQNPLRVPRKVMFERPKVVRTWCVFRQFSRQPRALFEQHNFQKFSGVEVLFRNALGAAAAYTF